jgi:hypothetical protein
MKSLWDFFKGLLTDEKGVWSSKRFIAILISLGLLTMLFWSSICKGCIEPNQVLIDGLVVICCVALGVTSVDKFALFKQTKEKASQDEE